MVQCAKCGFLTVRNRESRQLEEVDWEQRRTWSTSLPNFRGVRDLDTPLCFRLAFDLSEETNPPAAQADRKRTPLQVVWADRQCDKFTAYMQGFSPKEHRQVIFDIEKQKLDMEQKARDRRWAIINAIVAAIIGATATLAGAILTK